MKTIVVDVSGQGYGHLAQTAPVLRRLHKRNAGLSFVLRMDCPPAAVADFLGFEVEVLKGPAEARMIMRDAVTVDAAASRAAYRGLHEDWRATVRREAAALSALKADLLLSNIAYTSLAAAKTLSMPAIALSSINWLEIVRGSFAQDADMQPVIDDMARAYEGADAFLMIEPHMPMPGLTRARPVGPVARAGHSDPTLRERLGAAGKTLVLITSGGLSLREALSLPAHPELHWIVQGAPVPPGRADATPAKKTGLSFVDGLASVDIVVGKDSYGTLVEAACHAKRFVMAPRPDWPEADCLIDWGRRNCAFVLEPEALSNEARLLSAVLEARAMPAMPMIAPTGIEALCAFIEDTIGG